MDIDLPADKPPAGASTICTLQTASIRVFNYISGLVGFRVQASSATVGSKFFDRFNDPLANACYE